MMRPTLLHEALAGDATLNTLGINGARIKELQSVDGRPFDSGHFVILNWLDQDYRPTLDRGPRDLLVWVHTPADRSRSYDGIEAILSRITVVFHGITHGIGSDGVRVTAIRKAGASGNLVDEGWKTIARNATFRVLHDQGA